MESNLRLSSFLGTESLRGFSETGNGSPERRLMCAVIIQFLRDTQALAARLKVNPGHVLNRAHARTAIFQCESEHMENVCHLAGVAHDKLKRLIVEILGSAGSKLGVEQEACLSSGLRQSRSVREQSAS